MLYPRYSLNKNHKINSHFSKKTQLTKFSTNNNEKESNDPKVLRRNESTYEQSDACGVFIASRRYSHNQEMSESVVYSKREVDECDQSGRRNFRNAEYQVQ